MRGVIRRIEQGSRKNMNSSGRNLFVPSEYSGAGKLRTRDFMNYASLTHTLSARTFYEIRVSYSRTSEVNTELPVNTDQPYVEPGIGSESGWYYIGSPGGELDGFQAGSPPDQVRLFEPSDQGALYQNRVGLVVFSTTGAFPATRTTFGA